MDQLYQSLIGSTIVEIRSSIECLELVLDTANIGLYNPVSDSCDPSTLVGSKVINVILIKDVRFVLHFDTGQVLEMSLDPNAYTGPEAAMLQFNNGDWVVIQ